MFQCFSERYLFFIPSVPTGYISFKFYHWCAGNYYRAIIRDTEILHYEYYRKVYGSYMRKLTMMEETMCWSEAEQV